MTFDLFNELLNAEIFCFFYNCVWQSPYSKINLVLLFLIHQHGSPRTCLIIFNMFWCQHATFCGFVSSYGSPRTSWVYDFIMFLLIKSVAIKRCTFLDFLFPHTGLAVLDNWVLGFGSIRGVSLLLPATSESKSNIQLSWQEIFGGGRRDTYTFWYIISSDFNTIDFEIQWAGTRSCLIEFNPFRRASCISTQCTVSWCLFHVFCLYHARRGLVKSSLYGALCSLTMGFTAVKNTVCLSLLKLCPPGINPEFVMECKLIAHPLW